jgi:uncharacterized SAM-binding protein YcdF (DUF218 family)
LRRRTLLLAAVFVAWAVLSPGLATILVVREPIEGADAILVLSGSSVYDERLDHAIDLYRGGRAQTIVLTNDGLRGRWSRARQSNLYSIEHGRDKLVAAGIPPERIVLLQPLVRNTYDEAVALRDYIVAHRSTRVLIVTSPYHSRRALWIIRRVVAPANATVGIDSPPPGRQSPAPAIWWLSARGWQTVAAEYVKFAVYAVRHG